jgi:hypothetical protein
MRLGDFKDDHPMRPTDEVFTIKGFNYLITHLNQTPDSVEVLLISNDLIFAENISQQITVGFIMLIFYSNLCF